MATVTTQKELDTAIKAGDRDIVIRSPRGVWLEIAGSASVRAYGSASVSASGSASVRASAKVAVHLHSGRATITGGVLIDHTNLDLTRLQDWADYHGVTIKGDTITLFKALGPDLTSGIGYGRPIVWTVGTEVTATDWKPYADCGNGLHLSPTPHHATTYNETATRWVRCEAPVASIVIIPGGTAKCKAPSVRVVAECDVHGRDLPGKPKRARAKKAAS